MTLMPRARSSATSARVSLTCHAAWVLWSAVPTVLWVTSRRVPLPYLNPMVFSFFLSICRPSLP